jgi:hypothetical protein
MLDHSCQVQRHPLAERGNDLYETPAVAVEALLRVLPLPAGKIWPAAVAQSPTFCAPMGTMWSAPTWPTTA